MNPAKSRTYHDPVHGAITLRASDAVEALLIRLIDTPEFQRLRRIRQLDTAFLTFHSAEGSRFTHSLGAMALSRRVFDTIVSRYPVLYPHRSVVLVASLLHDLGHGPFSHAGEEFFGNHHEQWTCRLICDSSITKVLQEYDPNLPDLLVKAFNHTYPIPLISQLISSQLDCDRLDYLLRDGHFTGVKYGQLDLDRILLAMTYDPITQQLAVTSKGLVAIEHYLMTRYFMYTQVYNHPKNLAARFVLDRIFKRARQLLLLGKITADPIATAWLQGNPQAFSTETYFAADDITFFYHIQQWRHSHDPTLADLCRRYLDRDIFKTQDISQFSHSEQQAIVIDMQNKLEKHNLPAEFYCGTRVALTKGYTLYQQGISIQTTAGLQEITDLSLLVKALSQPKEKVWLVYPRLPFDNSQLEIANTEIV